MEPLRLEWLADSPPSGSCMRTVSEIRATIYSVIRSAIYSVMRTAIYSVIRTAIYSVIRTAIYSVIHTAMYSVPPAGFCMLRRLILGPYVTNLVSQKALKSTAFG